ncbi:hypothetical protein COJ85_20120 [Bacillus sp. AFS076308]|uniref:hypothetical protein n=1 Tax=Bacillus sp. AFS076308 TaxID=2033512 RepID=UPI000BFA4CBF|nr:hypothetical protein [Bacillus sp. AFS076308]PFN98685.1 hypothetical protein COJ85_20120 [Bacillus sp. AFS076308]
MAFSITFFIAWICITAFYAMKKPYSKWENSALLFCLFIVNVNWSWITVDELKFITYSKDPLDFSAYIINRSIIIPMLVMIGINRISRSKTVLMKVVGMFISSFVLILIKIVLLRLGAISFHRWNLFYDYVYFLLLHALGYLVLHCYHSFVLKGVKN